MTYIPKLRINPLPNNSPLVKEAFQSNQLVTGPHIDIFERGLASYFHYSYANTTSSGFTALFLALKSLDLKNAKVVVPAVSTCNAMTNAVLANGFEVIFCAIDPNHLSLAEEALSTLFKSQKIDVIIAPSHFGIPAPIEIYKKYGVPVIEDACQAFFTRTTVRSTADIMVLSFYPTKQFNCIEGGAILHNNPKYNQQIKELRYYDSQISYDGRARYNFRMPNIHAAFGCLQLERLIAERNKLLKVRDRYISGVIEKYLLVPAQCEEGIIPWRFLIKSNEIKLFENLKLANIQSEIEMAELQRVASDPLENWFDKFQSIPYFSTLKLEEQNYIIEHINVWN